MNNTQRDPRVIIIGAGVAGIATAVTLQRNGFHNFTILDKGDDVGGVWHWNRYPGLTCDVPSTIYQFGFAPNPEWSHVFAPGSEIQRYLRDVVDRFELNRHIRLSAEVTSAAFSGAGWEVRTADGTNYEADFVIAATGVLHHPHTPDIPGLSTFAGDVVHTARWDGDLATEGRRVAVIGTGSTGVQIVSALQPEARTISHFCRTPQWVMWAPMGLVQPAVVRAILRAKPELNRRVYDVLLWASGILADIATKRAGVAAWCRSMRVGAFEPWCTTRNCARS